MVYRARRAQELAAALAAAKPREPRPRGRQPGKFKSTEAKITLAAYLVNQGMNKWAMKDELYPRQASDDRAYDSTKKLLKREKDKIEAESKRLLVLPENELDSLIQNIRFIVGQ